MSAPVHVDDSRDSSAVRSEDDCGRRNVEFWATALHNILGLGSLEPGDVH